jgi:hypothetical protein
LIEKLKQGKVLPSGALSFCGDSVSEPKQKYKHQLVLKNSTLDIGFGPGVLFEKDLELSSRTLELLNKQSAGVMFAKIDCDTQFLMEHVEVRMVKE